MKPGKMKESADTANSDTESDVEEVTPTETQEKDDEKESLRAENERLKERLQREEERASETRTTSQPRVTSSQLRALGEKEREAISAAWGGVEFDEIVRRVESNERQEEANERLVERARVNVRDAIDDAVDADPQVSKLKSHIKDYMADIPASDKADANRLKIHMKKAIVYARGAAGHTKTTTTAKPKTEPRVPGPDDSPSFASDTEDDIKPGSYELPGGSKIRIENRMSDDQRKKFKHPDYKHGIRASIHQDEPPRFR